MSHCHINVVIAVIIGIYLYQEFLIKIATTEQHFSHSMLSFGSLSEIIY